MTIFLAFAPALGKLSQNLPAARRLRLQEKNVVAGGAVLGDFALQFLGDEHDRRKRRAELMGGGGGEAVERGQPLFAREHEFRRRKRLSHLPRLLFDAPGIDRDEDDARHERGPKPQHIVERQDRRLSAGPGQRQMIPREDRRDHHCEGRQERGHAEPLRRGGHGNGHNEKESKRVFEAARQVKKRRQLQHIVAQQYDGVAAR